MNEFKCAPSYDHIRKMLRKDLKKIRNIEARKRRLVEYRDEVKNLKRVCSKVVIDLEKLVMII